MAPRPDGISCVPIGAAADPQPLQPGVVGDGECSVTAVLVDFVKQLLRAATLFLPDEATRECTAKKIMDAACALLAWDQGKICLRHRSGVGMGGFSSQFGWFQSGTGNEAALFGSSWSCIVMDDFFKLPLSTPVDGGGSPLWHRAIVALVNEFDLTGTAFESISSSHALPCPPIPSHDLTGTAFESISPAEWSKSGSLFRIVREESLRQMEWFCSADEPRSPENGPPAVPFAAVAFILNSDHWNQRAMSVVSSSLCRAIALPHQHNILSQWDPSNLYWVEPQFSTAARDARGFGGIVSYFLLQQAGADIGHYEVLSHAGDMVEPFLSVWGRFVGGLQPVQGLGGDAPGAFYSRWIHQRSEADRSTVATKQGPTGDVATGNHPRPRHPFNAQPTHAPPTDHPRPTHGPPTAHPRPTH